MTMQFKPIGFGNASRPAQEAGAASGLDRKDPQVKGDALATKPLRLDLHKTAFVPGSRPAPVQLTVPQASSGQRERALAVVRQAPAGSVGAAIRPLLEGVMGGLGAGGGGVARSLGGPLGPVLAPFAGRMAREFAAGQVGEFYERQRTLLNSPATDANIAEFSRRETEFFKTQPWLAKSVGGLLSAEQRASSIRFSRDNKLGQ